ncbi:MAG: hypothetical protein CV087_00925 [Candidatus Brocadia sp. WS118]|nr:MAG: hypothetical protein CV087_00925 [Candidatus Brocadia sp. WS118]
MAGYCGKYRNSLVGMNTDFNEKDVKTEIEAKFVCPDGLDLEALLCRIHTLGFRSCKEEPCFQTDVYFDTPQYTLLHTGAALRIRQRGEAYVGTYKVSEKQQGAIFERREFEWKLSDDETKAWNEEKKAIIPPPLLHKLPIEGQTLRKVLMVETHRYTAILSGNDGFKAELSLDEVTFRGHKGQKYFREIEIELLQGLCGQLKQVTDGLQNYFTLQPAVDSKYRQGMILVGKYGIPS